MSRASKPTSGQLQPIQFKNKDDENTNFIITQKQDELARAMEKLLDTAEADLKSAASPTLFTTRQPVYLETTKNEHIDAIIPTLYNFRGPLGQIRVGEDFASATGIYIDGQNMWIEALDSKGKLIAKSATKADISSLSTFQKHLGQMMKHDVLLKYEMGKGGEKVFYSKL